MKRDISVEIKEDQVDGFLGDLCEEDYERFQALEKELENRGY